MYLLQFFTQKGLKKMPIHATYITLLIAIGIQIPGISFAAQAPDDGQESKQEGVVRYEAQTAAGYSALEQHQKDDLFIGAVARGDIAQAGLLLDCGARIDATSENAHLYLPEGLLLKLATNKTEMLDLTPQIIKSNERTALMTGISLDELIKRGLIRMTNSDLERISKRIMPVDVAVAHGHHDMVNFLLNHPASNRLQGPLTKMGFMLGGRRKKKIIGQGINIAVIQGNVDMVNTLLDYYQKRMNDYHFLAKKICGTRAPSYMPLLYLNWAELNDNHIMAQHLLKRTGCHEVDLYHKDPQDPRRDNRCGYKSPFHLVVFKGNDESLAQLLQHECDTTHFPELDNPIRALITTAKAEHATVDCELKQYHFPAALVDMVLSYKNGDLNDSFTRYRLVERLASRPARKQKILGAVTFGRANNPIDDGGSTAQTPQEIDALVVDLVITSVGKSRTSSTLQDAARNTPLALARNLLTQAEAKQDDDAGQNNESVDMEQLQQHVQLVERRQRCVELLERQPFALARALIQRQLGSQK